MMCAMALLAACGGGGDSSAPGATAPTIMTQPVAVSVSDGQAASFSVVAGGTTPLSYQWQRGGSNISGATNASYAIPAVTLTDNGAQFTVVVTNSAGSVTSSTAGLTVAAVAPTITAQPAAVTVSVSQPAAFSVTATGSATLSYQWKKNGTAISGATAATFTIPATAASDAGSYTVTVTNTASSVTSAAAVLTVNTIAPAISVPPANIAVSDGQTALFSVVATGTAPLSYQWKKGGVAISGATAASYTTPALTLADSGSLYTVVVSNAANVSGVTSAAATLTVNPIAPSITAQPANTSATDGATAMFTVVASGSAPLHYQWKNGATNVGTDSSTYTTPALTLADSLSTYTVVVSNTASTSATSTPATLTVNPIPPFISVQPGNASANDGATATFSVTATGSATLHYQWKKGATNVGTDSSTYTTPALTLADNGATYTVVVNNTATSTATSNAATLTVNSVAPSITTQPAAQFPANGATATFTVVASGGSSTLTYQWKKNNVDISGATLASYTTPAVTPADSGAKYKVVVSNTAPTHSVTSSEVTLTVTHTLALVAGGLGGVGNVDNTTGTLAAFHYPAGIGRDAISGNLYIADTSSHTIRQITPAGAVSTFAGTKDIAGFFDATGTNAQFSSPRGVAVDGAGNLYVADSDNNVIRKIDISGVVTTFAGSGAAGDADDPTGTGTNAQFNSPRGVAVDSTGNVYVADFNNYTIRKITPAGAVTTLAGISGSAGTADGVLGVAEFDHPTGVAVDAAGNVYVADTFNNAIRRIDHVTAAVSTLAGTAGGSGGQNDAPGPAASFSGPVGLSLDSAGTNLYVADYGNNAIRQVVVATGVVTTLAGSTTGTGGYFDATGTAAQFLGTAGTVVDATGNVFVADLANSTVRKIDTSAVVTTFAGNIGGRGYVDATGGAARFSDVAAVAGDAAGNIYVADFHNNVVRKIDSTGAVTTLAGSGSPGYFDATGTAAQFNGPFSLAVDSHGDVYVADYGNYVIRKIDHVTGAVSTFAGAGTSGAFDATGTAARFSHVTGLAFDSNDNLYVADFDNNTVRKVDTSAGVTTVAGTAGASGFVDNTGAAARFNGARGVATDAAGNVYVVDRGNSAIRKIASGGVVTTLAGGTFGYLDSPTGTSAQFNNPNGIAVDANGNVYVADYGNHVIRQVTSGGAVTTVAGGSTSVGVTPSIATAPVSLPASLNGPNGLAVLPSSVPGSVTQLAVAEETENAVLLVTLP